MTTLLLPATLSALAGAVAAPSALAQPRADISTAIFAPWSGADVRWQGAQPGSDVSRQPRSPSAPFPLAVVPEDDEVPDVRRGSTPGSSGGITLRMPSWISGFIGHEEVPAKPAAPTAPGTPSATALPPARGATPSGGSTMGSAIGAAMAPSAPTSAAGKAAYNAATTNPVAAGTSAPALANDGAALADDAPPAQPAARRRRPFILMKPFTDADVRQGSSRY